MKLIEVFEDSNVNLIVSCVELQYSMNSSNCNLDPLQIPEISSMNLNQILGIYDACMCTSFLDNP